MLGEFGIEKLQQNNSALFTVVFEVRLTSRRHGWVGTSDLQWVSGTNTDKLGQLRLTTRQRWQMCANQKHYTYIYKCFYYFFITSSMLPI